MNLIDSIFNKEHRNDIARFQDFVSLSTEGGAVNRLEKAYLKRIGEKIGLTKKEVVDTIIKGLEAEKPTYKDKIEKLEHLLDFVEFMHKNDNHLDEEELEFCNHYADGIGFAPGNAPLLVRRLSQCFEEKLAKEEIMVKVTPLLDMSHK